MKNMPRVLVTGAAGVIGRILCEDLRDRFRFLAADVAAPPDLPRVESVRIDIARDYPGLVSLVREVGAVVHLAYVEEERDECGNFLMAKNVAMAVREVQPPPRLILASSIHVVGGYLDWERPPLDRVAARQYAGLTPDALPRLTPDMPLRPNGLYGALKGYIEGVGRWTADQGVETVVLRFGGVRPDDAFTEEPGYHTFWLSRRDCAGIVRCALTARLKEPYTLAFAVSANRWRVHDLTSARDLLGFVPRDGCPG